MYKKRKIRCSIFSVRIFKIIILLLAPGMMFEICGFFRDITEDDKNNDRIFLKKKWKKGRENKYKGIVHKDKFKFNTWSSRRYKYMRREN